MWLGAGAFEIDDYSNFTREVEVVHLRTGGQSTRVKCRFMAKPLDIVETGVCPACGKQEASLFHPEERLVLIAKDAYRRVVSVYTDFALRHFLVERWWKVKALNRGKLHVDHVYPVSLGYDEGISEIVIGSPVNCQLLTEKQNLSKSAKPGQSLEALTTRYNDFVAAFPCWADLESSLARMGHLKQTATPKGGFHHDDRLKAMLGDQFYGDDAVREFVVGAQESRQRRLRKRGDGAGSITFEIRLDRGPEDD